MSNQLDPSEKIQNEMFFQITTSRDVAERVENYCGWEEKMKFNRSYKLDKVIHNGGVIVGFSTLEFSARDGKSIKYIDVFFLGHFSATSNLKPIVSAK